MACEDPTAQTSQSNAAQAADEKEIREPGLDIMKARKKERADR